MEHITDLSQSHIAAPVGAICWESGDLGKERSLAGQVQYKTTRSTLALNALDLSEFRNERAIEAVQYLLRTCQSLGRGEIVVECLEIIPQMDENRSLVESFNTLKKVMIRASANLNLGIPRIALEKRGDHYDVRVYLNIH